MTAQSNESLRKGFWTTISDILKLIGLVQFVLIAVLGILYAIAICLNIVLS